MQHLENGIEPDVEIHLSREDEYNDRDTILEKAIELCKANGIDAFFIYADGNGELQTYATEGFKKFIK